MGRNRYDKIMPMQRLKSVLVASAVMALCASPASAQDERRVGVVVAYPGSVGVQWQASDRLAIRFETDFTQFNTTSTTTMELFVVGRRTEGDVQSYSSDTRSSYVDTGVSVLIDIYRSDALRLYLAPRAGVAFERVQQKTRLDGLSPEDLARLTFPADSEFTVRAPSGGISVGARHDLTGRFRIFGEAGFHYTRRTEPAGRFGSEYSSSAFGLRSGVGAVILF